MISKKKILIFSMSYYPRFVGGAEVAIKEITDRVPDIDFHMVTLRYDSTLPKIEKIGNVLVHRIGISKKNVTAEGLKKFPLHFNKRLYQIFAAFKAMSLHKKYSYDGIWAMMAHSTAIPAGLFKREHASVPYLLTLQEGDPPEYIEGLMKKVWKLFKHGFASADYLQAISTFLLKWGKRMGFAGESVVIPNAVNASHFLKEISKEEIDNVKKEIGKKDGETWLITTSRLVHKNGIDDVIRSVALLPKNIHFLVLGTGPDEEKLKSLTRDKKVEERVHFYGFVDHAKIPAFYKACDVFIRPSRSEGFGNSFVEAMAAGLPVIATQEGGISDFLFDDERNKANDMTGWVVDKDSPEQIKGAVERILGDSEKKKNVLITAKNMVIEKYDWDIVASDMKKLFERVLS